MASNNAAGFNLHSNTNLNTTNWIAATPPVPVIVSTNYVVTNALTGRLKFHRPIKP